MTSLRIASDGYLGGSPLAVASRGFLGFESVEQPEDTRSKGWLPVVYLDENGDPVSDERTEVPAIPVKVEKKARPNVAGVKKQLAALAAKPAVDLAAIKQAQEDDDLAVLLLTM